MAWHEWVLAAAVAAAVWDLRFRRIPKWLTLSALAAGLGYHFWAGGFGGALLAACLGLVAGMILLQLGAIAGGDVKWLAALGAMLGLRLWLWSVEFGLLAAGVMALGQMAAQGRLAFVLDDLGVIIRGWRQHGLHPNPEHNVSAPGTVTAPFAVAMLAGLLCTLWLV